MKKIIEMLLFLGFAISLNIAPSFAKESPWEMDLPFERAVIDYDISGSQKGTETLYIRDFGNERVKVTKSKGKVLFMTTTTDTVEITTRDSVININMKKKTGTRVTNPQKIIREEVAKLSAKEREVFLGNFEKFGMNMAVQMGGEVKLKAGKHLDYACDLVTVMGVKSCLISGTSIALKVESNLLGIKINTVAQKVDKNKTVPVDIFQVPDQVKVKYDKEADDVSRHMIMAMISMMTNANGVQEQRPQSEHEEILENDRVIDSSEAIGRERSAGTEADENKPLDEVMQKGVEVFKGLFQ